MAQFTHENMLGNKNAKKSFIVVYRKFKEMYDNATSDDNILCFQDAAASIKWRISKIDYWIKTMPVFGTIKKDIQQAIICRINKNALNSDFNATASIWRMKQLGEFEIIQSQTDLTTNGKEITQPQIIVRNDDQLKKVNDFLKKE